jgi:hypothetical protein
LERLLPRHALPVHTLRHISNCWERIIRMD